MLFMGFLKIGKSLGSLAGRVADLNAQRDALRGELTQAMEARSTVIAQIGEELKEIAELRSNL